MSLTTEVDHQQRILKVLVHIQKHLDDVLSLESLAGIACFSPYHFHRVFAALVGESVMAHIRRLRLERAATRLHMTRDSVMVIALEAGYESHEAFTRAFRGYHGTSPSAFRKTSPGTVATMSPSGVHYVNGTKLDYHPLSHGGSKMEVKLENWTSKRVAFVRHIGPYDQCGAAWERLCVWAGPKGLLAHKPWLVGVSYDDPSITPPDKIRYDACLGVPEDVEPEGEIGIQTIAGGKYAVATHEGPYKNFHKTYSYLYATWLPENGLTCADSPCVEIYLNDPNSTPPEDLLTLVCIPVKKQ
jgi:AraC family transcriptional regulator